jgi:chromosome segregation ATPase
MATAGTAQEQNVDALAGLEERITRAVQIIATLRAENSQLQNDLAAAQNELKTVSASSADNEALASLLQKEHDDLEQKAKRLSEELEELRAERKQVRSRIEKLLNQLDLLSAS